MKASQAPHRRYRAMGAAMIGLQELCQKVCFAFIGIQRVRRVLRAHRAPSTASTSCTRPLVSQVRTVRDVLPTNLPISTSR
jgi:hypothetical protein